MLLVSVLAILGAAWMGVEGDFSGKIQPLSGPNGLLYDAATGIAGRLGQIEAWPDVAVILINRATLNSPAWQGTPRALQQPQLGKLGHDLLNLGAWKVGYDLVLALDPTTLPFPLSVPPDYDAPLLSLLLEHPHDVVLGGDAAILPTPRYADKVTMGIVDLQTEADGTVRSFATRIRRSDKNRSLGFAEALTQSTGKAPSTVSRAFLSPGGSIQDIPHLSAKAIEDCITTQVGRKELTRLLSGRLVIVGAGLDGEDEHQGPDRFLPRRGVTLPACAVMEPIVGRKSGQVPGTFLQASAVQGLLANPITLAPVSGRVAVNVAIACVAALIVITIGTMAKVPERRGWLLGTTITSAVSLILVLALLAGVTTAAAAVGLLLGIWLPMGTPMMVAFACCGVMVLAAALRRDVALADLRVAFGYFLPSPVIDAALRHDKGALRGSAREITVLIADLNGFTAFCATRRDRPQEIIEAINERFTAAQAAIDRHGGTVDKFVGDAVIAIWNGIERQDDHAIRAVAAAVDIAHRDPGRSDGALRFKCAVATGLSFVGRYGSEGRGSFSAIGEPMNLAARLVGLCHINAISVIVAQGSVSAISAGSAVPEGFSLRQIGSAQLKGFADSVEFHTTDPDPNLHRKPRCHRT